MIEFKTPWVLLLAVLIPTALWVWTRRQRPAAVRFSSTEVVREAQGNSWRVRLVGLPMIMKVLALGVMIMGLAGPRQVLDRTRVLTEGIDIVLAIDISGSMAAEDFVVQGQRRNRLEVVKDVVREFVQNRPQDRIALVAFARQAYTASPLTSDASWLDRVLTDLRLGLIEDGTAVGSGISSAVLRLSESNAVSKVIILLTDGQNNAGRIAPLEAAAIARERGVKIYTIGAGSKGLVPFPVQDLWGRTVYQQVRIDLDEGTLQKVAEITGGAYFRATDTESLRKIYKEIDALETSRVEQHGFRQYRELFPGWVYAALMMLIAAVVLEETVLMRLP